MSSPNISFHGPSEQAETEARYQRLMCGISGIAHGDAPWGAEAHRLAAMATSLAHRGPDAQGLWSAPRVGLAHRRLSIIDLSGGSQPLGNEDASVQVVFNGDIYNYRELAVSAVMADRFFRFLKQEELVRRIVDRPRMSQ